MKVYREVIVKGDVIIWIGSQIYGTKETVLEAINQRAEDSMKLFGYKVEDFNRHPWDLCNMKEGEHTTFLTVERKKEVIGNNKHESSILGFVTYELK